MTKLQLIILIALQFLDGILTYSGIIKFRTAAVEGNPIVRQIIELSGPIFGLTAVKLLAILTIIFLYRYIKDDTGKYYFNFIIFAYSFAVISWIYILCFAKTI